MAGPVAGPPTPIPDASAKRTGSRVFPNAFSRERVSINRRAKGQRRQRRPLESGRQGRRRGPSDHALSFYRDNSDALKTD